MKEHAQVSNACGMLRIDAGQLLNTSFKKFKAGIFNEDARLAHALVLVNRDPTLCQLP
jgi:hypothetical protein